MSGIAEMTKMNANKVVYGNDPIVIRQHIGGIAGGRTLDMTDFEGDVVEAGHIVVRFTDSDGVVSFKPLGVSDGAYVALEDGESYAGVVVATKPADEACVGIMDNGRVNDIAMPYSITDEQRAALKTALPNLIFEHD